MHLSLCVCALIPEPPLVTRTRLVLIVHRAEDRKSTNTGRLAAACLADAQILVRGLASQPSTAVTHDRAAPAVLLFPHEDAVPIERFAGRPVTLIVPDGTWRQASRVRNRVPGLRDLPCVCVPPGAPSAYRLRAEPSDHGLSTLEAIARALSVLEGPHVRHALERVFHAMVERTLWSRGLIDDVPAGLPAGARRHDPMGV